MVPGPAQTWPEDLAEILQSHRANVNEDTVRAVTSLMVTTNDIKQAIEIIRKILCG